VSVATRLVFTYAGIVTFLAILVWAGVGVGLTSPIDDAQRRRYRIAVVALLAVGLAHPAFALVGRDIDRQIQIATGAPRVSSRVADGVVVVSLAVLVAGIAWLQAA
jgi:hypothetical protein